jgi:hypothetical protein
MQECNIRGWENPFECPNGLICATIGFTEKTLIDVRNRLQQRGFINFEAGQRKAKSPLYTLLYCNKVSINESITVSKKVSKTVSKKVNLKNKTKTKTNNTPLPPKGDAGDKNDLDFGFEKVWELYGRKGNRKTSAQKWANLKNHCREAALKHIPLYVESTPDKQYRKNFETYLNQECWKDEIIKNTNNGKNQNNSRNPKGCYPGSHTGTHL